MAIRVSQTGIIVEYTVDDHAVRVSQTGVIIEYEPEPGIQVSQAGIEGAWVPLPPQQVSVSQGGIEIGQQPEYTSILLSQGGIEVAWIPLVTASGQIYLYNVHLGTAIPEGAIYLSGATLNTIGYDGEGNIYVSGVQMEH